ncbi:MAG TPA: ATP-dependent Clp protease adaptor ClpS [Kofleriaceae bacterium]|nr:ATP-dependent Clp protease adaptor ClpS [Kofleriaceae bacterium]
MDDLIYFALSAAGAATFWWRYRRRAGAGPKSLPAAQDEELEIALHVAAHEARARGQPLLPQHLLLSLAQSEPVAGAIRRAGGDAGAVEDRVFAALDAVTDRTPAGALRTSDPAAAALAMAAAIARHHGRAVACADLWFALTRPPLGVAELLDAAGVDPTAVLFVLAHGDADGEPAADGEVELILVNDDFSPQQLVVEVLRDALGLREDEATRLMLKTHHEGHASLGRHSGAHARRARQSASTLARRQGYPLWIRAVPAGQ